MHLKKSSLFFSFFIALSLSAQEDILSPVHENIFKLNKNKIQEESNKLTKDWINPIIYKYSKNYSDTYDTSKSTVSISQPIFKSGGIYSAIKYASSLKEYSSLDIDIQRKALIKDATKILFNLHKIDLQIQKQELLILNTTLDINRKKEQVLGGFLDTSFLDNAIIASNVSKTLLIELRFQKKQMLNNFSNLSKKEYKSLKLPTLHLLAKKTYIKKNLAIKKSLYNIKAKNNYHKITHAKYLPSINVFYDYNKYHDKDNAVLKDGATYGVNLIMPFDIRVSNDIQTQKIAFLLAKENANLVVLQENNLYKSKIAKVKMLQEKSNLAKQDYKLYDSLLHIIIEEKEAQLKTQSDVDTLKNSRDIKALDIKIFSYEEQIELLDLYAGIK